MSSIVVVSDLHIDVGTFGTTKDGALNSAWKVAHRTWMFSVRQAIERNANAVVVNGDMFDTGHPWVEAIRLFRQGLDLANEADMPVVLVGGNHELSPREIGHRHILEQFNDLPNVYVVHSTPSYLNLPDCNLVVAPWPDVRHIANHISGSYDLSKQLQMQYDWLKTHLGNISRWADASSFLVGHLMMDKTKFNNKFMEQSMQVKFPSLPLDVLDGPWTGSILGHVHLRQQLSSTISYAGCPWTITLDDAETGPHGPSLVTWDGDGTYTNELIPGPDRQLLRMDVHNEEDLNTLNEATKDFDETAVVIVDLYDKQLSEAVQESMPEGSVHDIRPQISKIQQARTGLAIEHGNDPMYALHQWAEQEELEELVVQDMIKEADDIWSSIRTKVGK